MGQIILYVFLPVLEVLQCEPLLAGQEAVGLRAMARGAYFTFLRVKPIVSHVDLVLNLFLRGVVLYEHHRSAVTVSFSLQFVQLRC